MRMALRRADSIGIAVVLILGAGIFAYRAAYIEPRMWGTICAAAPRPLACEPRAALLWLQRFYLWGWAAFGMGVLGFLRIGGVPVQAAGVAIGIAAIANYNANWGAVGLALGLLGWISSPMPPDHAA